MTSESPTRPRLPQTPLEAIGSVVREQIPIEDRVYVLERPGESDRLLDHPAIRTALEADEYIPYWTDLWPAARMLGKWIAKQHWPSGLRALEIGCGLGLPGIVALSKGLQVTFSDYDASALHFARRNAQLNGFPDVATLLLDWRSPSEGLQFPVLLAADLIYEVRNVEPLVDLIDRLLPPVGVCLLTDQDRIPMHVLREVLANRGLPYSTQVLKAGEPGGRRLRGTLYRIKRAGGQDPLDESSPC